MEGLLVSGNCEQCALLLSEGLDLCIRGRRLDSQERTNNTVAASVDGEAWEQSGHFAQHADRHNVHFPQAQLLTKSATLPLWVQDQYDHDLHEWETKTRKHLTDAHLRV